MKCWESLLKVYNFQWNCCSVISLLLKDTASWVGTAISRCHPGVTFFLYRQWNSKTSLVSVGCLLVKYPLVQGKRSLGWRLLPQATGKLCVACPLASAGAETQLPTGSGGNRVLCLACVKSSCTTAGNETCLQWPPGRTDSSVPLPLCWGCRLRGTQSWSRGASGML